ncbi:hypothetical protein CIB84_012918 [Bambusicola thoracicus]|uniref:Uncharacterized protein n=1 Tax=Bambusicola thoracicus TaxID=9083 RepID=A0A2P4SGU2_BAMTH|nr:hypothetical protein CIB84_012918 [Bambusicola thoracicus]
MPEYGSSSRACCLRRHRLRNSSEN